MASRAVIFDLDGTLVDTLTDITDAINVTFAEVGLPAQGRERVRGLVGRGLRELLSRAAAVDDAEPLDALLDAYRRHYAAGLLRTTRLYPDISTVLDTLTQRGMPMCVLSNKPHEFTAPICDALLSRWPFVRCTGATDESRRKPDPATALELAAAMNQPPETVFFVGDSSTDVMTAQNAGMMSIAVTWGYRDRSVLEAAGPDAIADTPAELIARLRC